MVDVAKASPVKPKAHVSNSRQDETVSTLGPSHTIALAPIVSDFSSESASPASPPSILRNRNPHASQVQPPPTVQQLQPSHTLSSSPVFNPNIQSPYINTPNPVAPNTKAGMTTTKPLPADVEGGSGGSLGLGSSISTGSSGGSFETIPLKEKLSMLLLLVLYTLQGIPMGLSGSIPLILKERGASYSALGLYSMVSLPFSLKLLWAPLVDSKFISKFGRRKTWLVPVQLLTGLVLILFSGEVDVWLGGPAAGGIEGSISPAEQHVNSPHMWHLTMFFGVLYLLMATQDVAVDGWALTMLSRENVGCASTCNTIGQCLGFFLANQGFIALSDHGWCHRFLGTPTGYSLLSLESFMRIAGYVFVVVTIFVMFFKKETPLSAEEEPPGLLVTYRQMASLVQIKPVQSLVLILLTFKLAFSPADSVSTLKMQEYGMPKADIAMFSPLILLVGLTLPAIAAKWVTRSPIQAILWGIPFKLFTTALMWGVLHMVKTAYADGSRPGWTFFSALLAASVGHEIADKLLFSAFMSFFAKVSDPYIGGTYMTFLNTISNLGYRWASSLSIYATGKFQTDFIDGYTLLTVLAVIYGLLWMQFMNPSLRKLEGVPAKDWHVVRDPSSQKGQE
jgi:PAT family acetyl-CoA transporter-like MFS transporter 1